MSGEYTPGPWEVVEETGVFTELDGKNFGGESLGPNDGWFIACANPEPSLNEHFTDEELSPKEIQANAHLIAAAPDLLEALEAVLSLHQAHHNTPQHTQARAAIRKAKGERHE